MCRIRSTTSQILIIHLVLEGVFTKNLEATLIFVDFSKLFDSIHREKTEQILLAYSLPRETVAAIVVLYKNTNIKVCFSDGDTDFFDIVTGVLQGNTLAPYLFIGGARGVVVIAIGNEHGDTSSNPGRDRLHFTLH